MVDNRDIRSILQDLKVLDTFQLAQFFGKEGSDPTKIGGELIKTLVKVYGKLPTTAKELEDVVWQAIFTQGSLSLADVGSDFADFSLGITFSRLLGPLEDAALGRPILEKLRYFFRHDDVPIRLLLRAIEVPGLSDTDLIEAAIYAGIRDKGIRKILILKRISEAKQIYEAWSQEDRVATSEVLTILEARSREIDSEIRSLEKEIRDIAHDESAIDVNIQIAEINEQIRVATTQLRIAAKPPETKKPVQLSVTKVLELYKAGQINQDEAGKRLLQIGLSFDDIKLLLVRPPEKSKPL